MRLEDGLQVVVLLEDLQRRPLRVADHPPGVGRIGGLQDGLQGFPVGLLGGEMRGRAAREVTREKRV